METEKRLLDDPIQIYTGNTETPEDAILGEEGIVKELAEIWRGHERALRLLVQVVNAKVVKRMVESALPVEIAGLRHELDGAENVLRHLIRYSELHRTKEPADGKPVEAGAEEPTNSVT